MSMKYGGAEQSTMSCWWKNQNSETHGCGQSASLRLTSSTNTCCLPSCLCQGNFLLFPHLLCGKWTQAMKAREHEAQLASFSCQDREEHLCCHTLAGFCSFAQLSAWILSCWAGSSQLKPPELVEQSALPEWLQIRLLSRNCGRGRAWYSGQGCSSLSRKGVGWYLRAAHGMSALTAGWCSDRLESEGIMLTMLHAWCWRLRAVGPRSMQHHGSASSASCL